MKADDEIDLLALHTVGARLNPQKSHALPQEYYADPAKRVRLRGEAEQRERNKARPGKRDKR